MGGGRGVEEFKEPMARFACHAGWIEAWGRLVFRGDTLEKRRLCIEWGWRVSSIISLRRQARIFIDYTSHPLKTASLIGKRTTVDEERKREQERERERERKVEGVVIYDTAARGSFHTFLQSLSSCLRGRNLSLCRSLNVLSVHI